jgi:hypothetical protein
LPTARWQKWWQAGVTPAEAIGLLRENVEQNGGYDKDLTRRSMLQSIKADHLVRSGDG